MKLFLLIVIYLCLSALTAFAQHEADNWYFGFNAGITFKDGSPTVLTDGKISTEEGCATISDKNTGELLFYTNGVTVWNSKHQIMKNGTDLMGGTSSTQSALIVPDPGNNLQYYIFTAPDRTSGEGNTTSLHYSLVSLKNPEGEVLYKNYSLFDGLSEKLTGTLDCSGKGFWVVAHHATKGIFYSYHVTSEGVNSTPIISKYTDETVNALVGYMKISPDRTKLALASGVGDLSTPFPLLLFNFNAETGIVTLNNILGVGQRMRKCYGVTFSPDNTKLYASVVTDIEMNCRCYIFQYDLSLSNPVLIQQSLFSYRIPSVYTFNYAAALALQLAPDGKIYVAENGSYVSIIEKPNLQGSSFSYNVKGIRLVGGSWGLPNFMDYIFNEPLPGPNPLAWCIPPPPPPPPPHAVTYSDSSCLGGTLQFTDRSIQNPTKRKWTFENGTPATSTDSIVTVTYTQVGTHKVQLIVSNNNGSDTTEVQAIIFPFPIANAGTDKTVCPNATAQLGDKPESGNTYSWQPITNLDNPTVSNPICTPSSGTTEYILTVTNSAGCVAYDTVLVTVGNIVAKVSGDTAICTGSSVQLLASGGSEYEWSPSVGLDNSTIPNPIATPITTTTYTVVVSSGTCRDSAMITVTVNPKPTANAGQDKALCSGEAVEIGEKATSGNKYLWQPTNGLNDRSLSNPIASPSTTTEYILTVSGVGGCSSSDTVLVTVGNISVKVSGDTAICEGSSVQLLASGGSEYLWSPSVGLSNPNISNPISNPTKTTTYKVIVSSGLCLDSAFVTVSIVPPPIANAGQDTIICIGENVQIGTTTIAGNSYSWNPSIGLNNTTISNPIASPNQTTKYILTVINSSGCVNYDTVKITVNPSDERTFTLTPSLITILPGQPFQTSLNVPSGVNSWNIRLGYDSLVVKFGSILQMSNGITVIPTEQNGQLTLQGKGENGNVLLSFNTFLPYNSDTTFPIKLTINPAELQPCETVTSLGNILQLGEYCGKRIRMVSSTGKNYFLTTKENGVNFGVGLTGNVRIELYDNIGSLKEVLVSGSLEAGEYGLDFDVPTGVYFCRMSAGMFERVGMVVIVR